MVSVGFGLSVGEKLVWSFTVYMFGFLFGALGMWSSVMYLSRASSSYYREGQLFLGFSTQKVHEDVLFPSPPKKN